MSNSIRVLNFDEWVEFRAFIEETFTYQRTFIFRGQQDSEWVLETTLDRLLKQLPPPMHNQAIVDGHLSRFKKSIRGKRGSNPVKLKNPNECWALGQHYGLATPLLDWSLSPYIATFFAFSSNITPKSGNRSVWAINTAPLKTKQEEIKRTFEVDKSSFQENIFEKDRAPVIDLVDPSLEDNPRIINQAGVFTRAPILMPIEKWVNEFCGTENKAILYKLSLPEFERETVLANLDHMNINSASLFPDLNGACMYCNEFLTLRGEMFSTLTQSQEIMKVVFDKNELASNPSVQPGG